MKLSPSFRDTAFRDTGIRGGTARVAAVVAAGGLVLGAWSGPAAGSASASSSYQGVVATGSVAKCYQGDDVAEASARTADGVVHDEGPTAAEVRAYEQDFQQGLSELSDAEQRAVARKRAIRIKVHAHVLRKSKRSKPLKRKKVKQQIQILNRAYAGRQSKPSPKARIRFVLKTVDWTTNKRWYKARYGTKAESKMKRKLRKGGKGTLNLYFGRPRDDRGNELLGYANMPADYKNWPKLDGVVINVESLPGGDIVGANKGDTGPHEVGHWLGLYHTFQGKCSKKNDRVRDTPAEAKPSLGGCRVGRDTCKSRGKDPVHNFMDYSADKCMDRFTKGQVKRMRKQWNVYRH